MNELKILSPTAILGYGFPVESFVLGMNEKPDVVAVDAGSTDPGPYYLGAGISFTDRNAVKRDLAIIIEACVAAKIPVIVGSCGGCGARPHLDWNVAIVKEIAHEKNLNFNIAIIAADIEQNVVLEKFKAGKISAVTATPELTSDAISASHNIVAQMGMEPIIAALEAGADVILAGRCYDPAVFAAFPVWKGYNKGLAIHLGKILECAAIAATPGSGSDCMMGYLGDDYFKTKPLNALRKCTTVSVSAHTLYEKSDPYLLPGPGGVLDLSESVFIQETENTVKVTGSKYVAKPYALKLEAAKRIGFRTVSIAGSSDPILIAKLNEIIAGVKARTSDNFKAHLDEYFLDFKIYGAHSMGAANGVSLFDIPVAATSLDESHSHPATEIGIVIEAVGATQEAANTICSFARSTMLHFGYTGRISTAGNLAFPFSPSDFKAGEVYEFSLYHLMDDVDPLEFFPIKMIKSQ